MNRIVLLISVHLSVALSSMANGAVCDAGQINVNYGVSGTNGFVPVAPYVTANTGANGNLSPEGLGIDSNDNLYAPILAGGNDISALLGVVRLTKGGVVDRSFGGVGFVIPPNQVFTTDGFPTSITVDHQDRLVVAEGGPSGLSVSRFLTSGLPDISFGGAGFSTVSLSNLYGIIGVTTQTDGKIIVAGSASNAGSSLRQALLVRLNSDGTLDATFGVNGLAFMVPSGYSGEARATDVAVLPDGRIVLGGRLVNGGGGNPSPFVARVSAAGVVDSSFGNGGSTIFNFGEPAVARKLAVQSDGKVVLSGSVEGDDTEFALMRVNVDGSPDVTFGLNGMTAINGYFGGGSMALQDNGKIVSSGSNATTGAVIVARFTNAGQLDTAFGTGGFSEISPAGSGAAFSTAVVANSSSKIQSVISAAFPAYQTFIAFSLSEGSGKNCR